MKKYLVDFSVTGYHYHSRVSQVVEASSQEKAEIEAQARMVASYPDKLVIQGMTVECKGKDERS